MRACLIFLTLLLVGCARPVTRMPEGVTDEEYAVYSALLESDVFSFGSRGKSLLIQDQTGMGVFSHGSDTPEQLQQRLPALTPEAISDYLAKNERPYPLEARLSLAFPYTLIGREKGEALCGGQDGEPCWDRVRASHPDAEGIVALSRVGFDVEMNSALVYWEAACCDTGGGSFFLLRRTDGMWHVEDWARAWLS